MIFISFDPLDEADLQTPHEVLADCSLQYTAGEWASMIFHHYDVEPRMDVVSMQKKLPVGNPKCSFEA